MMECSSTTFDQKNLAIQIVKMWHLRSDIMVPIQVVKGCRQFWSLQIQNEEHFDA
jgi:hypothetical protein